MSIPPSKVEAAVAHLRAADPVMKDLIARVGTFRLTLARDRFGTLVKAIVSQQLSTKAAQTIEARVRALVAPSKLTAENLSKVPVRALRKSGLSNQKAAYVSDLCRHVLDGSVRLSSLGRLDDEAVVEQLVQIKGIGRWTAQMFLIFSLGRLDVFPHDDFGIRKALRDLYGLGDLPDKQASLEIARPWRPYASVACWYCWRSLDGGA